MLDRRPGVQRGVGAEHVLAAAAGAEPVHRPPEPLRSQ